MPAGRATSGSAVLVRRAVLGLAVLLSGWLLLRPPGGGEPLPVGDKVLHAALFAVLGLVGWWSTVPRRAVLVGLALWGLLSELLQHLMGLGRAGDPLDLLADLVGLAIGLSVAAVVERLRDRDRGCAASQDRARRG